MTSSKAFRIAAVQATPVFMNLDASVEKACSLIARAGSEGARLAVFPEAFLPGYPLWSWFIPPMKTHPLREIYTILHENSVVVPGAAVEKLCGAARKAGVAVAIGINEKDASGNDATLYNTLLYIGPDGRILGKHRKLIPTAAERLIWGRGDGSDLAVYDLPFGRLSGLICWENYMPLARQALAMWGVQIYAAPTWDRGEPWTSSMRHIAKECRSFVIGCCSPVHMDDIPDTLSFKTEFLGDRTGWLNPGGSVITDPDGTLVAGPLEKEESILYADVDPAQLVGPRWQLDTSGHYARHDVFELRVNRTPRPGMTVVEEFLEEEIPPPPGS